MYVAQPFNPKLQAHAEAIGYVSINWTWLEFIVELLFSDLAELPSNKQETHCIVVEIESAKKLKLLAKLGYLKRPSEQWFVDWDKAIKRIEELREQRNRMVHDLWGHNASTQHPTKTQPMAKLIQRQSHARVKHLKTHETIAIDVATIRKLAEDINQAAKQLHRLMHDGKLLLPRKPDDHVALIVGAYLVIGKETPQSLDTCLNHFRRDLELSHACFSIAALSGIGYVAHIAKSSTYFPDEQYYVGNLRAIESEPEAFHVLHSKTPSQHQTNAILGVEGKHDVLKCKLIIEFGSDEKSMRTRWFVEANITLPPPISDNPKSYLGGYQMIRNHCERVPS